MNEVHLVVIDLGKNPFCLLFMSADGRVGRRRRCSRPQLFALSSNQPSGLVGIKACTGAHFVSRMLAEMGHEARRMSTPYVKPQVGHQTSFVAGSEAIPKADRGHLCDSYQSRSANSSDCRPGIAGATGLWRDGRLSSQTDLGLLTECGIVIRKGHDVSHGFRPALLNDEIGPLPQAMRQRIGGVRGKGLQPMPRFKSSVASSSNWPARVRPAVA
ncbi:MAG: hypothetical protein AAF968_24760 [Pseudomonadota bacterium]